jgi:putative phosphoribosyl transferase
MRFASRQDAGQRLADLLVDQGIEADVAVGLPRGGVIVAAAIADALHIPLEVLVVRKIGHPLHREFAVGALAEHDVVILDPAAGLRDPVARRQLNDVIAEETQRMQQYEMRFRGDRTVGFEGRRVLLADDGLATGATTEAAVLSARKQGAAHVTVAAPVASTNAVARLRNVADDLAILLVDPAFNAVGAYYESFAQTTDDEVIALLQPFSKTQS